MFYLFDYDGTIIDSTEPVKEAWKDLYEHYGIGEPTDEDIRQFIGPTYPESIERVFKEKNVKADQEEAEQYFLKAYTSRALDMTTFLPGMEQVTKWLSDNDIPRAIATNKSTIEFEMIGGDLPGIQYFDHVFKVDHDDGTDKIDLVGDATTLFRALGQGDGFMIGDRAGDIEAGKAHDLGTVGVLWGGGTEDELSGAGADVVFDKPNELLEFIKSSSN